MRPTEAGRRWAVSIIVAAIGAAPWPAAAMQDVGPGAKPVRSMIELRNAGVVRQHWDLTCGAAAIATLLTYQFGRPVSERQVATAMLRRTSPLVVRARLGFSLLDLKRYAADQGLEASGYSGLSLDEAVRMAPLITPIRSHGFRHFVILRGRVDDRVLIADPAFGNRSQSAESFEADWANRIGFAVVDPNQAHPVNRMGPASAPVPAAPDQAVRASAAEIRTRAVR